MQAEVFTVSADGDDWGCPIGTVIEVLGWTMSRGTLCAIWRDDEGYVREIPASFVRVLPRVTPKEKSVATWQGTEVEVV